MHKIPRIITIEELEKIIFAIIEPGKKINTPYYRFLRLRTAIMVYFMYYTGCRPKEAYSALVDYLDIERKTYFIPASSNKRRYSDEIPLPGFLIDKMYEYLILRNKYFKDSPYLFPTRYGGIERSVFSLEFREAVRKVGLLKQCYIARDGRARYNISLYNLRMSYGTMIYDKTGHDVKKTATMLRHRDYLCRSVMFYIAPAHEALERVNIIKEVFNVNSADGSS